MRITLKHEKHKFHIILPTRLLCSRTAVRLLNRYVQKNGCEDIPHIPPVFAHQIYKEIKRSKRRYGGKWVLLDMSSCEGDGISIKL